MTVDRYDDDLPADEGKLGLGTIVLALVALMLAIAAHLLG